ncbi:MAG: DNA polymerase III subunit delta [Rhodothermaceae bacterium]|nr:MAG: DNA polymerase III subunit delta [Rhodothermaceae bacterium]
MAQAGLTYETLETAFRHGNFKPLYFFFGEERFLIDSLQALLIEKALAPHERDFNLDIIYGAEANAVDVLARCAGYPVMAPRRVVIVRDFEKLPDNLRFKAYAEHPNPTAVVLLICGNKPNLAAHPYRALREHAAWAEFKPLYERQMPGWIEQRVREKGYRIDAKAAERLAAYVGTDLRSADAEIDKLITYAGGRETLTADDVVAAGGQTREYNVFELQRAVGAGHYPEALAITERLLQQASNARGEGLMIVSVLTGYFMKLWKLTDCQARGMTDRAMASRIGVSPYFIKEYLMSLRRYPPAALARQPSPPCWRRTTSSREAAAATSTWCWT